MTEPTSNDKVLGVIGLGSMGFGAALTALRKGVPTIGLDTRAEARERFIAEGGRATDSIKELGAQCDAVVVLVVNAAQTETVLFGDDGLIGTLKPGSVVICSATVDPTLPPVWQQRLAERGLLLIDAPVSGGATKAAAGQMTVMASGAPAAFEAAARCSTRSQARSTASATGPASARP